jgi:uncharacterized protein
MSRDAPSNNSLWIFFALIFALSVPLWIIGAATGLLLPLGLPFGALMLFNPLIAAALLVYRHDGGIGLKTLLWRSVDPGGITAIWFAMAIFLMPIVLVLEYGFLRISGLAVPLPDFSVSSAILLFAVFVVAAIGEEAGWQGYAARLLQNKHSALMASLILGMVWAIWHIVPFLQAGRPPSWIWWQCLTMLPARIIIVWLSNNTGRSILIAVLFHTMMNLSEFLFPNDGSHYDPLVTFVLLAFVATIVTLLWQPKTLTRFQYPRCPK